MDQPHCPECGGLMWEAYDPEFEMYIWQCEVCDYETMTPDWEVEI